MGAADELKDRIHRHIPLAKAMQFSIDELDPSAIRVSAPLEPNINIHGTGFAGSIYSLAVLTGWALCTHILEDAQVDAELVVARGEIRYRAPVSGELLCATEADARARDAFLQATREQGKGLLQLEIRVGDAPQAVLFATYCALLPK
jgi:thioesterase domain-containing protein